MPSHPTAHERPRVEMWKSTERIPTFPHATQMELDIDGRFIEDAQSVRCTGLGSGTALRAVWRESNRARRESVERCRTLAFLGSTQSDAGQGRRPTRRI